MTTEPTRRITRRAIPTCNAWYPNYGGISSSALMLAKAARKPLGDVQWHELFTCVDEGGLVEGFVSLAPLYVKPLWSVRIAFWGADDTVSVAIKSSPSTPMRWRCTSTYRAG